MELSDTTLRSADSLSALLRGCRVAAFMADAELIRDAFSDTGRDDEAHRYVREAMLLFALRRITSAERDRILDVLCFVIPFPSRATEPPANVGIDSPTPHGPFG